MDEFSSGCNRNPMLIIGLASLSATVSSLLLVRQRWELFFSDNIENRVLLLFLAFTTINICIWLVSR
jgi:hypothetical protein